MTAPTAEQANNAQRTQNLKMFKKRLCFWKIIKKCICLKKHGFPNKCKKIPLWCTQMGLSPWKIKWNQGDPGYWPPKCKNEIRGVQPHMLRKEKSMKIISHPTEGFAKIKSRGSRNKIKKVPSQHPKCSRNKTEGVQGQPMCLWNQLKNAVTTKQSIDSIYSNHTTQQNSTSLGTLDFIFPKIYQIFNPNISKPSF